MAWTGAQKSGLSGSASVQQFIGRHGNQRRRHRAAERFDGVEQLPVRRLAGLA